MDEANQTNLLLEQIKKKILSNTKEDLSDIFRRIKKGTVIPIVGNGLRNDTIFDCGLVTEFGGEDATQKKINLSVDECLSKMWAEIIDYPLLDTTNLARVALYNRVRSKDDEEAKVNYLNFLKSMLLLVAQKDEKAASQVPDLEPQITQLTFSDMVEELDYPHFPPDLQDPLRCLAQMPLPIYFTTSYYDFLERALVAENRQPRTQICFWSAVPSDLELDHQTQQDLEPSVNNPVVFHLFGWERYPSTLVLSEGDYLDYLLRITQDTDTRNPIIPLYLKAAMKASSLILLGYRLQDWDFKVLFRMIRESPLRPYSLLIQLSPEQLARNQKLDEARQFLEEYFRGIFTIQWKNSDDFIHQLCSEYHKWLQG